MSDWRIAKLRQLCDVATPGPWEWHDGALRSSTTGDAVLWPDNVVGGAKTVGQLMGACGKHAEEHAEVNATIIALASPDVLKALFTMLDGARAEGYAEAKEQAADLALWCANPSTPPAGPRCGEGADAVSAKNIAAAITNMEPKR